MNDRDPHWHSRGYIPHFDCKGVIQSITFRLGDSLPQTALKELESEIIDIPLSHQSAARRRFIEDRLDAGHGSCTLKNPAMASVMETALFHFDSDRYDLIAWCVMPNHVHVMIKPNDNLGKIVQSWKSFTSRWAKNNAHLIGLRETDTPFWMREYWDRFIRDDSHFHNTIEYIHHNPVKAGLCKTPEKWQWSSARRMGNAAPPVG